MAHRPATYFCKLSFIETHPHPFIYFLSIIVTIAEQNSYDRDQMSGKALYKKVCQPLKASHGNFIVLASYWFRNGLLGKA